MVICREFQRNIHILGQSFLIGSVRNYHTVAVSVFVSLRCYIWILTLGKNYAEEAMFIYIKNVFCVRYAYANDMSFSSLLMTYSFSCYFCWTRERCLAIIYVCCVDCFTQKPELYFKRIVWYSGQETWAQVTTLHAQCLIACFLLEHTDVPVNSFPLWSV